MTDVQYLLDTCTISYFLKLDTQVVEHLKKICPLQISISVITVLEIEYGFSVGGSRLDSLYKKWQDFLQIIRVIDFNKKTAFIASDIKKYLKQQGRMIGAYDILIAATALEYDLICVTGNRAEFSRVKDLQIEDWRV